MGKMNKISHRDKYLCSNCLYSGKGGSQKHGFGAPRVCPSCRTSDCCKTVWYRIRFPSKSASKTRWKECLRAIGWDKRIGDSEYEKWVQGVVKKVTDK